MKTISWTALCAGLVVAGCGNPSEPVPSSAAPDPGAAYEAALSDASAARDEAAALGREWTVADAELEKAAELAAQGHLDMAAEAARAAAGLYRLAADQARRESEAWRGRVLQ